VSCIFINLARKTLGTRLAFDLDMIRCENNPRKARQKTSRRSAVSMSTKAALACAVLLTGTLTSAQGLNTGTFGQQGLAPGQAGISSAVASINLLATLPSSVGLSISTVHLSFSVTDPTTPTATIRVPVTSFWHLNSSSSGVELVGYFDSPQQALVNPNGGSIPSSRVEGSLEGQPLTPFVETANVGTAGASRIFYQQPISRATFSGSRSDVINLQVDRISDLGLSSGLYAGTLHLRMVAY
jgi:hypothetical protein